ncbi:protein MRG1-like isoform X6 [Humulus lupulus]|uniref:protein MRG1-like isoform X6 n=1 Tax=Humulus lupulus TaxID=3486 RepID=UPI002B406FBC|nr:protein MRG1-like isoform X6 [Humulus lupulus]
MGSSNNTGLTDSSDIQKLEDADSCPFSIGEMVIAFHGHSFYAAKVLKIVGYLNNWDFFVHYHGWNKKWDEWVTTDRLMAYSEDNVRNHLAINKQQEIDKSMKLARSSNFKEKNANVFVSGKKRKNDDCLFRGNIHITMEMCAKIQIPLRLKKHLVDDCEFVTRMGKMLQWPLKGEEVEGYISLRKTIGNAKACSRLYYFDPFPPAQVNKASVSDQPIQFKKL